MKIISAEFVAGAKGEEQLPPPAYPEIVFAGRSNVGKSSLINSMLARKNLVRTSSTPGCTRAINFFRVQARKEDAVDSSSDAVVDFVDLPGFGYAKRSKKERKEWQELIEAYLSTRISLKAIILIVDIRRGLQEEDEQLIEYAKSVNRRIWLVATKVDKLNKSQIKSTVKKFSQNLSLRGFSYSSHTHHGREELWSALWKAATGELHSKTPEGS